jgi:hypothetical protein
MSGVRQIRNITCSHCGTAGTVGLGMPLVGPMTASREFSCIKCKQPVHIEAPREILAVNWTPAPFAGPVGNAAHVTD